MNRNSQPDILQPLLVAEGLTPPEAFSTSSCAESLALPQLAQAHFPGSQGHSPVSAPQLQTVLSVPATLLGTFLPPAASLISDCADSVALPQLAQAHFPGSHGQFPVSAPQLQTVLSVPATVSGSFLPALRFASLRASLWISRTCLSLCT